MSGIGQETNNIRYVTAGTSLITMADDIINCDSAQGAIILVLPNISGSGILSTGKCFKINDTANTAATHNITLVGVSGNKINDGATVIINTNGQSGYVKCLGLNDYLYDSPSSGMIGGFVGGSGTLNFLSKWTPDGITIGNSQIFDDGSNIGINSIGGAIAGTKLYFDGGLTAANVYGLRINGDGKQNFNIQNDGRIDLNVLSGNTPAMSINANGNIAVNLNSGTITGTRFYLNGGNTVDNPYAFRVDGNASTIFNIENNGNVGINNLAPTAKLHIKGIDATSSNFALKVDNLAGNPLLYVRNDGVSTIGGRLVIDSDSNAAYTGEKIKFEVGGGTWSYGFNAALNALTVVTSGAPNGSWLFGTGSSYSPVAKMFYDGTNSFFGINTGSTPNAVVHAKSIATYSANDNIFLVEKHDATKYFQVRHDGAVMMPNIQTFVDNAAALLVLPIGALYVRTGHGLDITV